MTRLVIVGILAVLLGTGLCPIVTVAQTYIGEEQWYENPLGFEPLALHTRNGFILPALAVAAGLLFTEADTSGTVAAWMGQGGVSFGYKYPYCNLWQVSLARSWRLRTWMSAGVELLVYHPADQFNNTIGVGMRPYARFYPVRLENVEFFFESGGGLVWFVDYFPLPTDQDTRLGTPWNGTTKYGIGADYTIAGFRFTTGIQHVHVSNGNTSGADRNPSHDSNGFYVGIWF